MTMGREKCGKEERDLSSIKLVKSLHISLKTESLQRIRDPKTSIMLYLRSNSAFLLLFLPLFLFTASTFFTFSLGTSQFHQSQPLHDPSNFFPSFLFILIFFFLRNKFCVNVFFVMQLGILKKFFFFGFFYSVVQGCLESWKMVGWFHGRQEGLSLMEVGTTRLWYWLPKEPTGKTLVMGLSATLVGGISAMVTTGL